METASSTAEQLTPGTLLGPYEIAEFVGQGGMGEVYRARDTRLDRHVALKILRGQASDDPRHLQRFLREAWILSSLNHPHICAIHDIGEHDGRAFLVMEFVQGEPLDTRIARKPLQLTTALTLARQIADALDAAHRRGFVHRDLKPSNVIITSAGAKLLDFGIAKLWSEPLAPEDQSLATTASDATSVPGTTAYIAPEQLEGRGPDPRADLFAFGVMLYEMLSGRRPFSAATRAGLIAAILEKAPEPLTLPAGAPPPAVERLILKCLEKDPDARWQTARDLSSELAWVAQNLDLAPRTVVAPARERHWRKAALAALALAVAVATGGWWFHAAAASRPLTVRFVITPPAGVVMAGSASFALSPDGRYLAFVGSSHGGPSMLWIQGLDSYTSRAIPGTDDAWHPFWSPDSQAVGFFAGSKLKAAHPVEGSVRTLADAPQASRASHGGWGRGVVIFNAGPAVFRVPAEGGAPEEFVLKHGRPAGTVSTAFEFLPDGEHFLFRTALAGSDPINLFIGSVADGTATPLLTTGSQVRYVDPGYLLYMRNGDLVAHPFDPRTRTMAGPPVNVSEPVSRAPRLNRAIFSASRSGVLAYEAEATPTQLVWLDRTGRRLGVMGAPGLYANPALSPDGTRVLVSRFDPSVDTSDIWMIDETRGERAVTSLAGHEDYPVWSNQGANVIFASDRSGRMRMYEKPADMPAAVGNERPIAESEPAGHDNWPMDWNAPTSSIVFQGANVGIPRRLLAVPTRGTPRASAALFSTPPTNLDVQEAAQAQISPDGRWIAYVADIGRSPQVFVKPFAIGEGLWQISTAGGFEPKWRGDGRELFYISPDRTVMSVDIQCRDTCAATPPKPLFRVAALGAPLRKGSIRNEYAVTRDGSRFLINEPVDGVSAYAIRIVVNWRGRNFIGE